MRRPAWKTWLLFGLVAATAAAGLSWLTAVLLRFEGDRLQSDRSARLSADLRLAVWRIDSLLAPVLTQEAARPPVQYQSFYPLGRSFDAAGGANSAGAVIVPSPVLLNPGRWVTLNFQVDEKGALSSPQVPPPPQRLLATANGWNAESLDALAPEIARLSAAVTDGSLVERLDVALEAHRQDWTEDWVAGAVAPVQQVKGAPGLNDFNARQRAVNRYASQGGQSPVPTEPVAIEPAASPRAKAKVSPMVPLWVSSPGEEAPDLLFLRRVDTEEKRILQGVLVDWPRIRALAENEVHDLFPGARLAPAPSGVRLDPDRALAVLPAELDPGPVPAPAGPSLTPVRLGIALLWAAFLGGGAVLAAGLRSLLALNRRRLDFVSAVTHELRTPLTTFRMYAEMLKDGMVPEEKRGAYFETLHEESGRLAHLVQNVLDYSRLESRKGGPRIQTATLEAHLERSLPALAARCAAKGVPFAFAPTPLLEREAALDGAALGQILFNLVDNACKYGEGEVRLEIEEEAGRLRFAVSDRGAGPPRADEGRIFEPFQRGDAASGRGPGVGLGLALGRRWARELGGDLVLERNGDPRFVLELPAADSRAPSPDRGRESAGGPR